MRKKTSLLLAACISLVTLLGAGCGTSGNAVSENTKETAIPAEEKQEENNNSQKSVSKEAAASDSEANSAEDISEPANTQSEATETADTGKTENPDSENETADTETSEASGLSELTDTETETSASATDEQLSALTDQVISSLPSANGNWSFYVCDLATGHEASYKNHPMQAASLIKLYIMGAVYENYDNLIAAYGKEEIDNNLYYMITVSDNDCANNLTKDLGSCASAQETDDSSQEADIALQGMKIVNQFCEEHGFNDSHMGRLLLASNEFDDNYTSVADCGHFLKAIRTGNTEEFPHAEDMFNLLSQQQRRHKIPSQLPEGVCVANKTGELDNVENDAGIIYNVENELVIVFMSDSLTEVGNAQSAIGLLSNMIYSYYNN